MVLIWFRKIGEQRVTLAALLLMSASVLHAAVPGKPPSAFDGVAQASVATPTFEFHSSFWVGAHQALHFAATARRDVPEVAPPFPDSTEWMEAVAYYQGHFNRQGGMTLLTDDYLVAVNRHLSTLTFDELPSAVLQDDHRRLLIEAADAMRAGWPAQDARNKAWIADLQPRVARHGAQIREGIASAYAVVWPDDAIRVDVSCFAGPVGAYTVGVPIHTTISSCDEKYAGDRGLEMLFHESSHPLFDKVKGRLEQIAAEQSVALPRQLWHSILFYTAGKATAAAVGNGYIPYAQASGMWRRGLPAHEQVVRDWQPYLDGETSMDEALDALVRSFPRDESPNKARNDQFGD